VEVNLEGAGRYEVSTSIGLLDHLLEQLARHGLFDITVQATGDIERGPHHLVEDVGLALGRGFDQALGKRHGILRFGHAIVPLDEALALVAVDLGGRAYAVVEADFQREVVGGLPTEMVEHFIAAFANEGRLNVQVRVLAGANDHHKAEAIFKALARALSNATRIDKRIAGEIPSTKDVL
jgi:imidazoleglycerol-phosphate dehydratase